MKERLKQDLERVFEKAPNTQKNRELKEEILANLYDKYDACVQSGMSPEEAYRDTVRGIGDLSSLFEKAPANEAPTVPLYDEKTRTRKKLCHDVGTAVAVMMYILSVLPVILWDSVWMVACLFLIVALATGMLILLSGTNPILVPSSMSESERSSLRKRRVLRAGMLAGSVMLYILCVCPVILIPNDRIGVPIMFALIALATAAIILRGTAFPLSVKEENDPVLPEAELKHEKKTPLSIFFSILSTLYWLAALIAYFAYSFATGRWAVSWLIFLYAGLAYAIAHGIWRLIIGKKRGGAIVKIVICSILLFAVLSPNLLLGDTHFNFSLGTSRLLYHDDDYSVGNAELPPETAVTVLDIEWIEGPVFVRYWDENYISVSEESNVTLAEENQLRYRLSGETLSVKYQAPRVVMFGDSPTKTLTVCLPRGTHLEKLSLGSVSGSLTAEEILAEKADLTSVSGSLFVENCQFRELDTDTVSGEARISLTTPPAKIDLDSVSGSATLTLPDGTQGYEIEFDSVSGGLTLPSGATHREDGAVYGDKSTKINFDSVSGGLTVKLGE